MADPNPTAQVVDTAAAGAVHSHPNNSAVATLLPFSLPSWYAQFRANTMKTSVIHLTPDFMAWLCADGIVLPVECDYPDRLQASGSVREDGWSNDNDDDDDGWTDDEGDEGGGGEGSPGRVSFPELTARIDEVIGEYGAVFPKMNWSAPKDASWVNASTLKCTKAADVYTLLKASDFVNHDVLHGADMLVLRKWSNLHKSGEWRTFVCSGRILAVAQRDCLANYPFLILEKDAIVARILAFYGNQVAEKFREDKFVMDVYVDRNSRVWLVDFNMYSEVTEAGLFSWAEILALEERSKEGSLASPEVRIVMDEKEVKGDPLASYRAPIDAVDLASGHEFEKFMNLCEKQSQRDSDGGERRS